MNTYQQSQATKLCWEEKDDVATQAETLVAPDSQTMAEKIAERLPLLTQQINRHHEVCARISQGTFSSDKILRMMSSLIKLTRCYNIVKNLKSMERLSGQIAQVRRLLRYDRITMITKEYLGFIKKARITKMDGMLAFFKLVLLFGDINDVLAFFMQLRVIKNDKLLGSLRKNVADVYFLECLGWLLYHIYEYWHSKDEESAHKNRTMIIKYMMDSLTSHNDFSNKLFAMDAKLASLIGAASSLLNLYLIWK